MARGKGEFSTGLWIGMGAFFLVFSCVPLGTEYGDLVFFWDLFGIMGNSLFGAVAVYVLAAGVALIVLANLTSGVFRGIAALSLGGGGMLLSAVALAGGVEGLPGVGELDMKAYAPFVVPVLLGLTALLLALVGNNVRIHHRDSRLGRMLGGTGACIAGALILVAIVVAAVHLHGMIGRYRAEPAAYDEPVLPLMLSTYPVPQIVCGLPLVVACVLMGLNLAETPRAASRARTAQRGAFLGLGLLGLWMVLGPATVAAIEGDFAEALWGCLRRIRLIGFPYCFALMVGGGLAEAARGALAAARARAAAIPEPDSDETGFYLS